MFFHESEIGTRDELEYCLIKGALGQHPDYNSLPVTIFSRGMESYASWMMGLTRNDPEERERATNIYLRTTVPREILYPRSPRIGTRTSVPPENLLRYRDLRMLAATHSHHRTDAFSDNDVDKNIFFQCYVFKKYRPSAEILTSPEYNFLFLRTNQTGLPAILIPAFPKVVFSEYLQAVNDSGIKLLPEEKFGNDRFDKELTPRNDFLNFCYTLFLSIMVDKVYKLGFYYSRKDGLYKRVRSIPLEEITKVVPTSTDFILMNFYRRLLSTILTESVGQQLPEDPFVVST